MKAAAIALWCIVVSLIAPILVMAYGLVFGHNYSDNQLTAGGGLMFASMFVGIAAMITTVEAQ